MRRYDLLVFDWDGTLADSTATIVSAIRAAAGDLGLAVPTEDRARHVIGLGLHDALSRCVPDLAPDRVAEYSARYRTHYASRLSDVALFDGVEAMLSELAADSRSLAIATGKTRAGLDSALQAAGIGNRFGAIRCADQCRPKPHPQMLLELLDETRLPAHAVLMIGDTTHDLDMARAAGVGAVAVTYGAHPADELRRRDPLALVDSVDELSRWLKTH